MENQIQGFGPPLARALASRSSFAASKGGFQAKPEGPRAPAGLKPVELRAWLAMSQRHADKAALVPTFSEVYSGGTEVRSKGMVVRIRPLRSFAAAARIENGKLVYHEAYTSTDSLQVVGNGRSEEYLLLRDARAPPRFEYDISAVSGVKEISLMDNAIHFKNAQGRQMEIEAPWLIETGGKKTAGAVHWELSYPNGPSQPRLALVVTDAGKLYYPVVIDPTWVAMDGSLNTARERHTATLLANGQVLVVGGQGNGGDLDSAELYDPTTGNWTLTGSLNMAREWHTATLLPNGRVLVVGGSNACCTLDSAELYDPATGNWTVTGSLNSKREAHTATLLPNGRVLVAGGADNVNMALRTAEIYDPATGSWTVTGSFQTARYLHTATLLPSGQVLVAGGYNDLSSVELYDPATGIWTVTRSLNTGRQAHTATLLSNGQVLVAGGSDGSSSLASAELYDPAAGAWSITGSLNAARSEHTATLLANGQVLVEGGEGNSDYPSSTESYDLASGTWTSAESLNAVREMHTATLLTNGQVLLAGGYDSGFLTSCELYDPATGMAQTISDFATVPPQTLGVAPFAITPPTATSGLPVTVTVISGPATILGNTIALTGAGMVVLAADQAGNATYDAAPEVTTSFTVTAPPSVAFAQWEAMYALAGGATDMPQHDGVSNLIKYLVDINPTQPMSDSDKAALPKVGLTTILGVKYLTLTYRRNATVSGLVVDVETSTDVQNWSPAVNSQTVPVGTDAATGDTIMQVQVQASGPQLFVRLNLQGS